MHIVFVYKGKSPQAIDTVYNIGDIITLKNTAHVNSTSRYRPLLCDMIESKYNIEESWPVEVTVKYTICDISVSAASGVLTYSLHYGNDRLIFPSGNCCVSIHEIEGKVDSDNYESDPAVVEWCNEVQDKISSQKEDTKDDPQYYRISDPSLKNADSGNRTLRKEDWHLKQKDWVVMWGEPCKIRKPYVLERDWVVNHAFELNNASESSKYMLIREKDIEKYIRERCMSTPLF